MVGYAAVLAVVALLACWTPATVEASCDCTVAGDPHFSMCDQETRYDFQGLGLYQYFKTDEVELQCNQIPFWEISGASLLSDCRIKVTRSECDLVMQVSFVGDDVVVVNNQTMSAVDAVGFVNGELGSSMGCSLTRTEEDRLTVAITTRQGPVTLTLGLYWLNVVAPQVSQCSGLCGTCSGKEAVPVDMNAFGNVPPITDGRMCLKTPAPTTPGPTTSVPTPAPTTPEPTTSVPTPSPTTPEPTTSVPTPAPTTPEPTTSDPTAAPTLPPTLSPTDAPTALPSTLLPTLSPTGAPTELPSTLLPTLSPTGAPAALPSTLLPTMSPTGAPTAMPSTLLPTLSPTGAPTAMPSTLLPTLSPTGAPAAMPSTLSPTLSPTAVPAVPGVVARPAQGGTPIPTGALATGAPANDSAILPKSAIRNPTTPAPTNYTAIAPPSSKPTPPQAALVAVHPVFESEEVMKKVIGACQGGEQPGRMRTDDKFAAFVENCIYDKALGPGAEPSAKANMDALVHELSKGGMRTYPNSTFQPALLSNILAKVVTKHPAEIPADQGVTFVLRVTAPPSSCDHELAPYLRAKQAQFNFDGPLGAQTVPAPNTF